MAITPDLPQPRLHTDPIHTLPGEGLNSAAHSIDFTAYPGCPNFSCDHDAAAHDDNGRCHEYNVHYHSTAPDATPHRTPCRCGWPPQLGSGGRL